MRKSVENPMVLPEVNYDPEQRREVRVNLYMDDIDAEIRRMNERMLRDYKRIRSEQHVTS